MNMVHGQHLHYKWHVVVILNYYVLPRVSYVYIHCWFIPSVVWRFWNNIPVPFGIGSLNQENVLHLGVDIGAFLAYWRISLSVWWYFLQFLHLSICFSVYWYVFWHVCRSIVTFMHPYVFNMLCHTPIQSCYLMQSCLDELPGIMLNSSLVRLGNFTSGVCLDIPNDVYSHVKPQGG